MFNWRLLHSYWRLPTLNWQLLHSYWRLSTLNWQLLHSYWRLSTLNWQLLTANRQLNNFPLLSILFSTKNTGALFPSVFSLHYYLTIVCSRSGPTEKMATSIPISSSIVLIYVFAFSGSSSKCSTVVISSSQPSSCLYTGLHCFNSFKLDRKSTRLNSSHVAISYAVFCMIKNNIH